MSNMYLHYQFIRPACNMNFSSYYSNPYSILNTSTFNVMNLNFEQQYYNLSLKGERYFNPSYMQSMTPWMELSNIGIGSYLTNLTAQMPPQAFLARQSSLNPYQSILSPVNPVQAPGTVVGNGNGDGDPETEKLDDDKIIKGTEKHKKLKKLQTLLDKYSKYTDDENTQILINTTLKRLEGAANQESFTETKEFLKEVENDYEKLTELYKKLDKKEIKKYILEKEFGKELRKTGYNFDDNEQILNAYDAIKNTINDIEKNDIKDKNPFENAITQNDIIEIISYYNDNSGNTIIMDIINKFDKKHDKNRKESTEVLIKPLVSALLYRASYTAAKLTKTEKDKIKELKKTLTDALNEATKDEDGNNKKGNKLCSEEQLKAINEAFNELYIRLRQLEAMEIGKEISKKYEFLDELDSNKDDDIINEDDILNQSKKDMTDNERIKFKADA